ncbi:DUF4376 domain-containing protein [Hafnia alvei]|uniref:DUF4376 domain-containing protein n=1 Tax=Hafnia alvei TaxID=569 RepID=UPI0014130A44|nr:DUF4376 domain-containing protein [Hafnia alvei]QIP56816.1 DUF4376 domain-containing protein [Hafnia alvei]
MNIKEIKNAHYLESGAIDCDVLFEGMEIPLPYTATADDNTVTGQQIWQELQSGKWGNIAPFKVTAEMLEAAKAARRQEIEAWRTEQEEQSFTFEYAGHTWNGDQQSMARLSPVTAIVNTEMRDVMSWGDANNELVPLNAEQLKGLSEAMALALMERNEQIYLRQRELKGELEVLTDLKAVREFAVD